jgi:ribonuclease HI
MSVGNNFMELMAAVSALESVPDGWAGTLYTDNELTIGRLTRSYALNNVTDDLIDRMGRVLRRLGAFRAVLLDGHPSKKHLAECKGKRGNPTSEHNKYCDWLCGELADAYMLGIGT